MLREALGATLRSAKKRALQREMLRAISCSTPLIGNSRTARERWATVEIRKIEFGELISSRGRKTANSKRGENRENSSARRVDRSRREGHGSFRKVSDRRGVRVLAIERKILYRNKGSVGRSWVV